MLGPKRQKKKEMGVWMKKEGEEERRAEGEVEGGRLLPTGGWDKAK